jgi:hypothetical protein
MSVQQAGTDIRALRELEDFPLVEALFGRRSRRFARGGEIPDGPLAYRSGHEPVPLSELGGSAQIHHPGVQDLRRRQAQYVFDTFGKFPGTVPSVFIMNYVQAHHLDPGFTTGSSNPAHICARTPSTCNAGHAGPEGV